MTIRELTKEIEIQKESLRKMIEENSNIQATDIIKLSQELDELIKKYYILSGHLADR
mgnify:CR=1 FL=1